MPSLAKNIWSLFSIPQYFSSSKLQTLIHQRQEDDLLAYVRTHLNDVLLWQSDDHKTALYMCLLNRHWRVVSYLVKEGDEPLDDYARWLIEPLQMLSTAEMFSEYTRDLAATLSVKLPRVIDDTVFYMVSANHVQALNRLVPWMRDINLINDIGCTPLTAACMQGPHHDRSVDMLLQLGANPNLSIENGLTPLMLAAAEGCDRSATHLLKHGAAVNATNHFQESALHVAVDVASLSVIKLLVCHGADMHLCDVDNISPFHLARGYYDQDPKKYLLIWEYFLSQEEFLDERILVSTFR